MRPGPARVWSSEIACGAQPGRGRAASAAFAHEVRDVGRRAGATASGASVGVHAGAPPARRRRASPTATPSPLRHVVDLARRARARRAARRRATTSAHVQEVADRRRGCRSRPSRRAAARGAARARRAPAAGSCVAWPRSGVGERARARPRAARPRGTPRAPNASCADLARRVERERAALGVVSPAACADASWRPYCSPLPTSEHDRVERAGRLPARAPRSSRRTATAGVHVQGEHRIVAGGRHERDAGEVEDRVGLRGVDRRRAPRAARAGPRARHAIAACSSAASTPAPALAGRATSP